MTDAMRTALLWQSNVCNGMGAPLSAEVLRLMADDAGVGVAFEGGFAPCAEGSTKDLLTAAYPLRALGALHFLVLSGRAPGLAARYGAGGGSDLAVAAADAARANPEVLARFIASPPQTNEVRRSLCLFGGFLTVAKETGLPLRCLELGASAGLNQNWDRFHYDLGEHGQWGDPAAGVKLAGAWTGGAPPLDAKPVVAARAACDQRPIDVRDDNAALGLLAYVWPDQPDRMQRARAAIALARQVGVALETADAADWTAVHAKPRPGVATVLYHSVFWQYPPETTLAKILQNIEAAGAAASREAPFAWLRMEPAVKDLAASMEVRLTTWPGGEERLLARCHPHGASVHWLT